MEDCWLVYYHSLFFDDSGRLVYDLWCQFRVWQHEFIWYKRTSRITADVGRHFYGGYFCHTDVGKRFLRCLCLSDLCGCHSAVDSDHLFCSEYKRFPFMVAAGVFTYTTGGVCQVCNRSGCCEIYEFLWVPTDDCQEFFHHSPADFPADDLYYSAKGDWFSFGLFCFLSDVVQGRNVRIYFAGRCLCGSVFCNDYEVFGCGGRCNGYGRIDRFFADTGYLLFPCGNSP